MLKISEFFKRIQSKQSKEMLVRSVICIAIEKYAQFTVPIENIDFNSTVAVLKGVTAMQRSQIYIKKAVILSEVNSQQSIRAITDIR